MRCKNCNGTGRTTSDYLPIHEKECYVCKGLGTVKRFLVENLLEHLDVEKHLSKEPHPEYRLVSIIRTKHETHTLYWERKD